MQIPFQIEVKSSNVLGMIHVPKRWSKNTPVIMICYGLNGNRVDNNRISVALGRRAEEMGIILVRFDYRGLGISDRKFSEIDMDTKAQDALEVYRFVKGCLQGEDFTFYLLGFSDGCRIVASLLKTGLEVDGLILWSPIFYIEKRYVESKHKKKFQFEPGTKRVVFPFKGLFINPNHLRQQVSKNDDFDIVEKCKKPILRIFGGGDVATLATYQQTQNNQRIKESDNTIIIPDADHLYSKPEWTDRVMQKSLDWVLDVK